MLRIFNREFKVPLPFTLFCRTVIHVEGEPYLVRFRLFSCPWFGIFLHQILKSDGDRFLHDHPWNFWTFILSGYYKETTPTTKQYFYAGDLVKHKATDFHRLQLDYPVWTLFVHGKRQRIWGFQTDKGWVAHNEYDNIGTIESGVAGD